MHRFNALTLTAAHALEGKDRLRVIRQTGSGGGPSPHRHALQALVSSIYDKEPSRTIIKRLQLIADEELSEQSIDRFLRMTHLLSKLQGSYVDRPSGHFCGPNEVVRIHARPHASVEQGTNIVHVVFWNNKAVGINDNESTFTATAFHKALPHDVFHRDRYLVFDVNNGTEFEVAHERSNSAITELDSFVGMVESELSS